MKFDLTSSCKHDVDPSTRTIDTMKGIRGTCKHCGLKVMLIPFMSVKREPRKPRRRS